MNPCARIVLATSVVTLLSACGGGSGGGSDSTVSISSTPVAITPANAETVTGVSYEAAVGINEAGIGAGSLVGAVTTTNGASFRLNDFAFDQVQRAGSLFAQQAPNMATGAVASGSEPCASGSMSYTINDADNSQTLSTGDTFDVQFNSCSDGSATISGGMSLTGITVTGDIEFGTPPWSLQATFSFNNLTVTEAAESASMAGAVVISMDSSDGVTINSQLTGSSLVITAGADAARLSNFDFSASEDLNSGAYSVTVDATIDNNAQGGRTTITTVVPFEGIDPNDPHTGEAVITGAGNSNVRLIVIDSVNVQLDVDENGDGTVDNTINTTWSQLQS